MKKEILQIEDIQKVVDQQYGSLLNDKDTAPVFAHLNLKEHLPHIYSFWNFIVLNGEPYSRNVFEKHVPLSLTALHFEKWMQFLHEAIYTSYQGPAADKWWNQAKTFETIFRSKMDLL